MKKLIIPSFCLGAFLFIGNVLNAQGNAGSPGNAGNAGNAGITTNNATAANVLKWTKEVLPKMEQLSAKLDKIKPESAKDIESQKTILKALQTLRSINTKGTKLTAAEARRHDTWFSKAILTVQNNCPDGPDGSECCFSCSNGGHGWNILWCFTNCFVVRFPGID
jgi:hypothetical protein